MKVMLLYRPQSDHEREVIEYVREFTHRSGHRLEVISLDTVAGDRMAALYGATDYPAVIAVDDDGVMQNMWQGMPLPLMNEVSYYAANR